MAGGPGGMVGGLGGPGGTAGGPGGTAGGPGGTAGGPGGPAVHDCSLVLRPLPPPTWPGNKAICMIQQYAF